MPCWQYFLSTALPALLPATLLLFFVHDRLQSTTAWEPLFLGSYFLCAALAIPLWLRLVASIGLVRTWGLGMLLSIAVFVFAAGLGAGDTTAFLVVCALSGVALETGDLALPGHCWPESFPRAVIADAQKGLLWLVEFRHQTQSRAGSRHSLARVGRPGLRAWHAGPRRP